MNKADLIKIFLNLGFNIQRHSALGDIIVMSAEDAFLFSSTAGAKYMFYENGVTMKGRSEVFIHRSVFSDGHLIYSPGLFSQTVDGFLSESNSAERLQRKYPAVFNGNKKILIYDVPEKTTSNIERDIYAQLLKANEAPEDYVLYKNFLTNNVGESLQEYFASVYFIKLGYIVENQVPWFQQNLKYNGKVLQGGIPDFSAFTCRIVNDLRQMRIIDGEHGISVHLLPVIGLFRPGVFQQEKASFSQVGHELLIGEAKTSASSLPQAIRQLNKYKNVNITDAFFTIIPDSTENAFYGSMFIEDLHVRYAPKNTGLFTDERILEDDKWMDTYIKMLLLGNLSFEKIITFISEYREKTGLAVHEQYQSIHLLDAVQNTDNEEFLRYLSANA